MIRTVAEPFQDKGPGTIRTVFRTQHAENCSSIRTLEDCGRDARRWRRPLLREVIQTVVHGAANSFRAFLTASFPRQRLLRDRSIALGGIYPLSANHKPGPHGDFGIRTTQATAVRSKR
jgi:hypothetical protein